MLFREFCELVEKMNYPIDARKKVRNLIEDNPTIVCCFLMGKPLEKKIGYSKKTLERVLFDQGICLKNYTNPGNAAAKLNCTGDDLSIEEVWEIYNKLSETSNNKYSNMKEALFRFNDLERKYFVNILLGKMQNGIGWGTIKYALADKYNTNIDAVNEIYKRTQSVEKTVKELEGEIEEFQIGIPIMSQLSLPLDLKKIDYPVVGEPKLDGFRAQIHIKDKDVTIFSGRNITSDKTASFPDIVEKVKEYPDGVYDGEIIGYNNGCLIPFSKFQHRITAEKNIDTLINQYPAEFIAFDLLHDGTSSMLVVPFIERHIKLENRIDVNLACVAIHSMEEAIDFYHDCIEEGYEGIILKTYKGLYYPGEGKTGHKEWIKYKPAIHTYDCLIIGAKWGNGYKHDVLASFELALEDDLHHDNTNYYPVGNVGNGFTMDDLEYLTKQIIKEDGTIPTREEFEEMGLVIEIKADMFLKDSFRFPRFVAIRDKSDIDKISAVLN